MFHQSIRLSTSWKAWEYKYVFFFNGKSMLPWWLICYWHFKPLCLQVVMDQCESPPADQRGTCFLLHSEITQIHLVTCQKQQHSAVSENHFCFFFSRGKKISSLNTKQQRNKSGHISANWSSQLNVSSNTGGDKVWGRVPWSEKRREKQKQHT